MFFYKYLELYISCLHQPILEPFFGGFGYFVSFKKYERKQ